MSLETQSPNPELAARNLAKTCVWQYGYGSKLTHHGTAGFGPWFHLLGFHLGYLFLTHSHISSRGLVPSSLQTMLEPYVYPLHMWMGWENVGG